MVFKLRSGNALGCMINSHRDGWRGSICDNAAHWKCGSGAPFREGYCAQGVPHCFHLNVFADHEPGMRADEGGFGWLLEKDPHALDDQVLLVWGRTFAEPSGVADESSRQPDIVFGAYRIERVEYVETGRRINQWLVHPYKDGWTRFAWAGAAVPPNYYAGGKYLRIVNRSSVRDIFENVAEQAERPNARWFVQEDAPRFKRFHEALDGYLDQAADAVDAHYARMPKVTSLPPQSTPSVVYDTAVPHGTPLPPPPSSIVAARPAVVAPVARPAAPAAGVTAPAPQAARAAMTELPAPQVLVDPKPLAWIREAYGEDIATALRIASLTKPLTVLRGAPGSGKSHLALRLLDDEARKRTHIEPVSATWRGRENLFGYVNPVNQEFEPTPFTMFLIQAAQDWKRGDKAARNVVFEEMNLSQPEHWGSDLLVVLEFSDPKDRVVKLGGKSIRGLPNHPTEVEISPALRFVGTINSDHTTRPLSPRVLDRAAVIDLTISPEEALERVGVTLDEDALQAVTQLDYALESKAIGFSIRSAKSLQLCLQSSSESAAVPVWSALDFVLAQELLSKVRLMARDPADIALLKKLRAWEERFGSRLPQCSNKTERWGAAFESGLDVVQA